MNLREYEYEPHKKTTKLRMSTENGIIKPMKKL